MGEPFPNGSEAGSNGHLDSADTFVLQHLYKPAAGDILYHYCSMDSFEAIIRSGKVRMSDINLMNDFAEMQWGYHIFEVAASSILQDRETDSALPDRSFFDLIDQHLAPANLYIHPLIACFSRNPDVLSQWRGYASDGTGVAIGFDATKLTGLAATLLNCEYDTKSQIAQMRARLLASYSIWDEFPPAEHAAHLFGYLPALKHPAFQEEAEVRAVHLLDVEISESGVQLTDSGGHAFGKDVEGENVEFSIRQNVVGAYIDLPYFDREFDGAITEVVLGPKNPNAPTNISALLLRHGCTGVTIKASSATYR